MDNRLDYTLLYRVAKAYYEDNMTQQEIAEVENFSRPQISRLLKKATEEGLVTYSLNFPAQIDEEATARRLQDMLGLEQVVLVPSFYGGRQKVNPDDVCKNLSLGVADKLADLLGDAKNVGIGWGRALYNTSLYVRPPLRPVRGRTFLPLIGLSGDNNPMLQINTIVDRFGERYHSERYYVNMQSLQTTQSMAAYDPAILRHLRGKWDELDAAVLGIGSAPTFNTNLISEFPKRYKKQIQSSGTVGDILSQFFYEDGRVLELDAQYRLLAMDIGQLRRVPKVIAIAAGAEKCRAIPAAARLGYIKTLVTDYDTAVKIIQTEEENEK